jgi:hypothetical protein
MADKDDGKLTPFDFINSVSHLKNDLMADEENEKQYNAFIVNRGLSMIDDSILHANEMNRLPHMPAIAQYQYYMQSLRKRKRFSKWQKSSKDENLDLIQEIYSVRREVAKQYMKILTPDRLSQLKKISDKGGNAKNTK